MSNIKIALTHEQNRQLSEVGVGGARDDVDKALISVQQFIDNHEESLVSGELNIIALEAAPNHQAKKAVTVFLFINLTEDTIIDMRGHAQLEVADFDVEFEEVNWTFTANFLGELIPNAAVLVMKDVAMTGRPTKANYKFSDLQLKDAEIKITKG